jgi:hypothetical protein
MGILYGSCDPFEVAVSGGLEAALARAKSKIEAAGGSFCGDTFEGSFSAAVRLVGTIEGRYSVEGNVVTVTITSRPKVVACGKIEGKIREFFA